MIDVVQKGVDRIDTLAYAGGDDLPLLGIEDTRDDIERNEAFGARAISSSP